MEYPKIYNNKTALRETTGLVLSINHYQSLSITINHYQSECDLVTVKRELPFARKANRSALLTGTSTMAN